MFQSNIKKNMNTRILVPVVAMSFVGTIAFGQMNYQSRSAPVPGGNVNTNMPGNSSSTTKTTKTTYPKGVKAYLDQQMAGTSDKKFHVSLNGKDVSLTPVQFHQETKLAGGKSAMAVDMKGADGKVYQIDFVMSGEQVTGAKVGKINGKAP